MIFTKLGNIFSKNKDIKDFDDLAALSPDNQSALQHSANVPKCLPDNHHILSKGKERGLFFDIKTDRNRRQTADKALARPKSSDLVAEMDRMIKENILYPEVEDTQEDILEDTDFENLQFLKEDAYEVMKTFSPKRVLSSGSQARG